MGTILDQASARDSASGAHHRILLVTPQPFYEDRGTPIAVADTCRALGELGYEIDLLAFPIGEDICIPGVTIHRCPNPFGIRSVPIGFSARKCLLDATLLRSFEYFLNTRDYDVVHAVEEAAYLAAMLCPRFGKPFIYDMASSIPKELSRHKVLGMRPAQRTFKTVERNVLRRASHVVCSLGLGDYVRGVAPHAPITEWRFSPVVDSADERTVQQLRSELKIPEDSHVLVYSGNFARYQGIDLLFEAFARALAADPALMLVCVGANKDSRDGMLSGLNHQVRSRVRILTRQSRSRMPNYFALAGCLISLRPVSDNLPLKVFDYMVAGKPIVATTGPAHEPVLNSERAFMCDPRTESITQAILEVFRSANRAEAVARSARWYALHHYGWNRFVHQVDGLYGSVMGTQRMHDSMRLRDAR